MAYFVPTLSLALCTAGPYCAAQQAPGPDSTRTTKVRPVHALRLGSREAYFGGPHIALTYEYSAKPRLSIVHSLGGWHSSTVLYGSSFLDPNTGLITNTWDGVRRYTSLLYDFHLRYYLISNPKPLTGPYVGAGLGFVFEKFAYDYVDQPNFNSTTSDLQNSVLLRLGYQFCIRKRILLDFTFGADISADSDAPENPARPWAANTALLLTANRSLQVGYRF